MRPGYWPSEPHAIHLALSAAFVASSLRLPRVSFEMWRWRFAGPSSSLRRRHCPQYMATQEASNSCAPPCQTWQDQIGGGSVCHAISGCSACRWHAVNRVRRHFDDNMAVVLSRHCPLALLGQHELLSFIKCAARFGRARWRSSAASWRPPAARSTRSGWLPRALSGAPAHPDKTRNSEAFALKLACRAPANFCWSFAKLMDVGHGPARHGCACS